MQAVSNGMCCSCPALRPRVHHRVRCLADTVANNTTYHCSDHEPSGIAFTLIVCGEIIPDRSPSTSSELARGRLTDNARKRWWRKGSMLCQHRHSYCRNDEYIRIVSYIAQKSTAVSSPVELFGLPFTSTLKRDCMCTS